MTSTTTIGAASATRSTLAVLARQEIRNYLRSKVFWVAAALMVVVDVVMLFNLDEDGSSTGAYMLLPAVLLGVLGIGVMFRLTRQSDQAAEAAGAVAVPERTRTLALAAAIVVPFTVALVSFVIAVVAWYVHPPASYVVPPGIPNAFVHAQQFGDGVLCAVGGPLLGLLLARYLPKRGVTAVASVLLILATVYLQGGGPIFTAEQRYRVFWVWTYFLTQRRLGGEWHMGTYAGNPFLWVLYLVVLCALGVVLAVLHDPEADRSRLRNLALGLAAAAAVLGVLSMTVGYTDSVINPEICSSC